MGPGCGGLGAQPGKEEDFKRAASRALEYAALCDIYSINVGAERVPNWAMQAEAEAIRRATGLEHDPSMDSWSSLMWMNQYGYTVDPNNR